ncbi:MAG: hypothetical protein MJ201_01340 [Mycoplasmoidaceae bacterium]|nr:hypothetical protein [Mycoplasmoidaceae bacterium]
MFEYTLENGKHQLKIGLQCLIAGVIIGIVLGLFTLIPNLGCAIAFTVLGALAGGILGIIGAIKVIFGAVVYHAERTSHRSASVIDREDKANNSSKQIKEKIRL